MAIDRSFDVVVVGSANLDLVARTPRLPKPGETVTGSNYFEFCGGKGANQAIAASRAGARTAFIGALGNDHAGETLRAAFKNDNVDISAVRVVSAPTGRALIGVSDDGENSIIVIPGANHAITIDDLEMNAEIIASAKVLLCQLEVPLEVVQRAFELAGENSLRILNPAPAQSLSKDLLQLVDVITPNEHEMMLLGGPQGLLKHGVKTIIVTQGARGALMITKNGETQIPPFKVDPIDSTGAGDAFCGMLAARLAIGEPIQNALKAAVVSGALATLIEGAVPSLPIWNIVLNKLESM
ncbi:ribokinase [Acidimicrobiaceae bacterium]|nr:ribokinase [Acidimicrobiaceae bacterium]